MSLETGGFDVREFARTAQGSFRAELDLAAINAQSVGADALRLLRMLRDLERSTMQRMRNLLVTATHKDARVTAFLTTWAYEKFWIADALDAVLEAGDNDHAADARRAAHVAPSPSAPSAAGRSAVPSPPTSPDPRSSPPTSPPASSTSGSPRPPTAASASSRAASTPSSAASSRSRTATSASSPRRRSAASPRRPRASKLTRTEIKRSAWPIGAVDRAADDRTFFETIVFGTPAGAAEAGRIRDLVAALPGLASVAPTVSARLVP